MLKFIFAALLVLVAFEASPAPYQKTLETWQSALEINKLGGASWAGIVGGNGVKDRLHKNKQRTTII